MKRKKIKISLILAAVLIAGTVLMPVSRIYADEYTDEYTEDTDEPEIHTESGNSSAGAEDIETEDSSEAGPTADDTVSAPNTVSDDNAAGQETEDSVSGGSVLKGSTLKSNFSESAPSGNSVSSQTVSDPNLVTSIASPETTEITVEYKPALDSLREQLPETVTIKRGDKEEVIEAVWICRDDYDETLGDYHFIPDMTGYKISEDTPLPVIMVHVENETGDNLRGYIASELAYDVPEIGAGNGGLLRAGSSSSYDPRNSGKLPVVRNQNPYGTCWAHATIGAAEADLIHDGALGTGVDLSEIHLAYYATHNYTDPKGCRGDSVSLSTSNWADTGGNIRQAYRYLSNMVGIVDESSAPYSRGLGYNPGNSHAIDLDYVRVKNAYVMSISDTEAIKAAIQSHGGVATAYYDDNGYYSSTYNSYYVPYSYDSNHAVMLVGWNDNFSRNNFRNGTPQRNGAWLVRNSWGDNGDGHNGYFWISYYDNSLLRNGTAVAIDATLDTYDNCYAYDGQPVNDYTYYASNSAPVAQTYDVKAGETLKAVGFEIGTANVMADITVTDRTSGRSVSTSYKTTYAGFYTAEISGLDFTQDSTVEVSIRYRADSENSVIVVCEGNGYVSFGSINYTGRCDRGFTMNGYKYNCDARMKLYTDNKSGSTVAATGITLNRTTLTLTEGQSTALTATVTPTNATNRTVTWLSSNTSVATVNNSGYVTALKAGTAVITAKTSNNKSATCNVTVNSQASSTNNVSVYYRTHIQNIGWQGYASDGGVAGTTGRALRLEGINIYVSGDPNLGILYTTHCQDYGWLAWSANNEMSGTQGESKRLEAIMINLTGSSKGNYDVYYRVHTQDIGWMGWASNGAPAGTEGYSRRLEAIQIMVVKKGTAFNRNMSGISSATSSAYISGTGGAPSVPDSNNSGLSYRTHVQDIGWQSWRANGQFAGTSGQALRLEGININLTNKPYAGGIRYKTHVQNIGWQNWCYDGAMSGTTGQALRLEAINIELYGDMARYYDVYYRVHAQDIGWMGWARNGASAGTAGYSRRLEGIQIVIVAKGTGSPGRNYGGITSDDDRPYMWR